MFSVLNKQFWPTVASVYWLPYRYVRLFYCSVVSVLESVVSTMSEIFTIMKQKCRIILVVDILSC